MIDVHCHILPGIDDGPINLEESIVICKYKEQIGVNQIIATPHYIEQTNYAATASTVIDLTNTLQAQLNMLGVKVQIYPGMEIFINPQLPEFLKNNDVLTLNKSKYVLVELPKSNMPEYTDDIFYRMLLDGYVPVLAHPERNGYIQSNFSKLMDFVDKGVLVQTNADSLRGNFGRTVQKFAVKLLKNHLVHFIGTDSHRFTGRSKGFEGVEEFIAKYTNRDYAKTILHTNPERLLENKEITAYYSKQNATNSYFSFNFLKGLFSHKF